MDTKSTTHYNYIKKGCVLPTDKFDNLLEAMNRKNEDVTVSCSVGVAFAPVSGVKFYELYKIADKMLYCTKEKGKNCYSIA